MKKWMLAFAVIILAQLTFAQTTIPAPKPKSPIPQLQLLQLDSTTLTNGQLKKEPTIIMYFSPTCDHCQHQVNDMIADMKDLSHYQIILATYQPFDEIADFYKEYKLDRFANIKIGRDVNFKLPPYYNIRSLPYLALYTKTGELITTFEGNVKVEKLIKAFE